MMLIVLAAAKTTGQNAARMAERSSAARCCHRRCSRAACSHAAPAQKSARSATTSARAEQGGNPPFYDEFGKRYHVLASSDGYREHGVASWYGHPLSRPPDLERRNVRHA